MIAEWLESRKQQGRFASYGQGAAKNTTPEEASAELNLDFDDDEFAAWRNVPQNFVIEDVDNAAVHLLKNALGGNRRNLFVASTMMGQPLSRSIRDDMAIQILFFQQDFV